jgi:hypothetical protein
MCVCSCSHVLLCTFLCCSQVELAKAADMDPIYGLPLQTRIGAFLEHTTEKIADITALLSTVRRQVIDIRCDSLIMICPEFES